MVPLEIFVPTGKPDAAITRHEGTALAGAGGGIRFDTAFAGPTPEDEPMASSAFILDLASLLDPASVSHEDFGGLSFCFYSVPRLRRSAPRRYEAHDCKLLEELCRYITRPALSAERVQCSAAGQALLKLKTPCATAPHIC